MLNTIMQEELRKVNFPIAINNISGIPEDMGRVVVRTDHAPATPLGIVGSRYKPIPHIDAFGGALKAMESGGIDFTNAKLDIESYEDGALAKMELLLPSHTAKIGNHDLSLKFVARNSYNARWKFQSFFGWMNHVCFNTLVSGEKLAYTASRHTKFFNVEQANLKIKNAVSAVTTETKRFQHWWDKRVEDEDVAKMFKSTIAKSQATEAQLNGGSPDTNKKQLHILMGLYESETKQIHGKGDYGRNGVKGSLWCAYQSATAWSTHLTDIADTTKKQHIVQQRRQADVRNMILSKSWKDLELA